MSGFTGPTELLLRHAPPVKLPAALAPLQLLTAMSTFHALLDTLALMEAVLLAK
jgi:hypothetical protein